MASGKKTDILQFLMVLKNFLIVFYTVWFAKALVIIFESMKTLAWSQETTPIFMTLPLEPPLLNVLEITPAPGRRDWKMASNRKCELCHIFADYIFIY